MKIKSNIILEIPTIDLVECRKFKGGYNEYWGGVLDPGYCEADGPGDGYSDTDDEWLPDDDFVNPENDEELKDDESQSDEDARHDGEDDRSNDGNNDSDNSDDNITKETPLTADLVSRILQGTGINFVFDQGFLDNKSGNQKANGALVFAGQTLPNGEIAEKDTIVLGTNATVGTLLEEMFHSWQADNLYTIDGSPDDIISPMEFMHKTFDAIFDFLSGDVTGGDGNDEIALPQEWLMFIMDCYNWNPDNPLFDWETFFQGWDDNYFDQWKELHDGTPYGQGDDTNWDWDWEDAKDWWDEHYGQW